MEFILNIIKYAAIIVGGFYMIKFLFSSVYAAIYNFFFNIKMKRIKKANEKPTKENSKKVKLYEEYYHNELNTVYIGKA